MVCCVSASALFFAHAAVTLLKVGMPTERRQNDLSSFELRAAAKLFNLRINELTAEHDVRSHSAEFWRLELYSTSRMWREDRMLLWIKEQVCHALEPILVAYQTSADDLYVIILRPSVFFLDLHQFNLCRFR